MKKFGLIGFPLGHSYSKAFFSKKFEELSLDDHSYDLFEMEQINEFPALWLSNKELVGVNVTVPHKESVLKYLDRQDVSAIKVGAANVVYKKDGKLMGFNTDYIAFKESLQKWTKTFRSEALILGSGGASKAVQAALSDLDIPYNVVSRSSKNGDYTYSQLKVNSEILDRFKLIINTTPIGMHPNSDVIPEISYERLGKNHLLYDLVYNPSETKFMSLGKKYGTKVKNGLEMLELQAERSWDIWNS